MVGGAARRLSRSYEFVALDVTSEESWTQALPQAIEHLGGLDILVNNAGIEIAGLLVDIEPADVRRAPSQDRASLLGLPTVLPHPGRGDLSAWRAH